MAYLNRELRTFAEMLGRKYARYADGAAEELDEIAEFRLSQLLAMDQKSDEFQAIWTAVHDYSCALMPDDDPEEPEDYTPTETELSGMPFRSWSVALSHGSPSPDGRGVIVIATPFATLDVEARTIGEAIRRAAAADSQSRGANVYFGVKPKE